MFDEPNNKKYRIVSNRFAIVGNFYLFCPADFVYLNQKTAHFLNKICLGSFVK